MTPGIDSEVTKTTNVPRRVGVTGAAFFLVVAAVLVLSAPAFAAGPKGGTKLPGAAIPSGTFASGTPFSSGQVIEVKVPPNSVLTPGAGIKIVECGAPHGVPPTNPSDCDGSTIQGNTVYVNPDGSVDYKKTATTSGYTVYSLPNFHSLGEPKDSVPKCDTTHLCVLYIGQNQLAFTAPHYWSEPFKVAATPEDSGANPGDGTISTGGGSSNALLTIGLPVIIVVAGAAFVVIRRRRTVAGRINA